MIEYLLVGFACMMVVWLASRQTALTKQLARVESGLCQGKPANSAGLEESVSQMIDELKAAADSACQEVSQSIDHLKRVQGGLERVSSESPGEATEAKTLPIALVIQLADEGLRTIDIARQVGIGLGEVELALRFRRRRTPTLVTFRRTEDPAQSADKEVAVA